MKLYKNKHCPRCNKKMPIELVCCPNCQLNFQKFYSATNKEAKMALKQGEKERVLLRIGTPEDVSRIKLLLLAIFLGFMGAHHYYVGRTKMGLTYTIFCLIGLTNAILSTIIKTTPSGDLYQIFTLLVLGWGLIIALWIIDIAKICLNKFKIPVSRD